MCAQLHSVHTHVHTQGLCMGAHVSVCEQRAALHITGLGLWSWGCPYPPSQSWDSGLGRP